MRVILNIDDQLFDEMTTAADIRHESVDVMLSKLFEHYLLNTAKHVEQNDLHDIEEFRKVFMRYMNEQILEIQDMPKSERYKEDDASYVCLSMSVMCYLIIVLY